MRWSDGQSESKIKANFRYLRRIYGIRRMFFFHHRISVLITVKTWALIFLWFIRMKKSIADSRKKRKYFKVSATQARMRRWVTEVEKGEGKRKYDCKNNCKRKFCQNGNLSRVLFSYYAMFFPFFFCISFAPILSLFMSMMLWIFERNDQTTDFNDFFSLFPMFCSMNKSMFDADFHKNFRSLSVLVMQRHSNWTIERKKEKNGKMYKQIESKTQNMEIGFSLFTNGKIMMILSTQSEPDGRCIFSWISTNNKSEPKTRVSLVLFWRWNYVDVYVGLCLCCVCQCVWLKTKLMLFNTSIMVYSVQPISSFRSIGLLYLSIYLSLFNISRARFSLCFTWPYWKRGLNLMRRIFMFFAFRGGNIRW